LTGGREHCFHIPSISGVFMSEPDRTPSPGFIIIQLILLVPVIHLIIIYQLWLNSVFKTITKQTYLHKEK
jgi:hypothetical protein